METGRPIEQRHHIGGGVQIEASGVARGGQKRSMIEEDGGAQALVVGRHDVVLYEPVQQGEGGGGVLAGGREVSHAARGQGHHILQTRPVASREGPQPSRQVVMQDQVPPPEDLFREEIAQRAVSAALALADEVLHRAMEDEHRRRTREIHLGKLRGPGGQPLGGAGLLTAGVHLRSSGRPDPGGQDGGRGLHLVHVAGDLLQF